MSDVKRGNIIKVPDTTPGLIACDGKQIPFKLEGVWSATVAPALNQKVDLTFGEDGELSSVKVVSQEALAREKIEAFKVKTVVGAGELAKHTKPMFDQMKTVQVPKIKLTKPVIGGIAGVCLIGGWFMFHGGGTPTQNEVKNAVIDKVIHESEYDFLGRKTNITDDQIKKMKKKLTTSMKFRNTSCKSVKDFNNYWDCKMDMITPDNDIQSSVVRVMRNDSGKLIYVKESE